MRALVYHRYGSPPEVMAVEEIDRPSPAGDEVVVEVRATGLNSWDVDMVVGSELVRPFWGLFRPRAHKVLGCDVAGTVVEVGPDVARLKVGDDVFGDISAAGWGGLAEYVCVREEPLAIKPADLSFVDAAAVPQAGVLAVQGLRHRGDLVPEHRILLNGAGGGVGTFALQIAKARGAHVTAVDRADKLDMVRDLGADEVIDYALTDFTAAGPGYDLILDVVGRRSMNDVRRALSPGGVYVMAGGTCRRLVEVLVTGPAMGQLTGRKTALLLHRPNTADLDLLAGMITSGEVRPVIDRTCALADAPQALADLGAGRVRGKAVVIPGSPSGG